MRLPVSRRNKPVGTLLLTAGATAAFGGPVRRWLTRNGKLDVPNHRSSHRTPVPRGGGIAVLLGATTAAYATNARLDTASVLSIAGLAALGWLDDVTGHVSTRTRLLGQLGAGAFGLSRDLADTPLAAITTAGVVNVFNFMDGINGISGLTAVIWGANALTLEDESHGELSTLGALTAGVGIGFLPHNVPAARLFLGDVGSYALGGAIAAGILSQSTFRGRYHAGSPLVLYAADVGWALARKAIAGQRLTSPHRDHVYQRLVDLGFTHSQVALLHAVLALAAARASRSQGVTSWIVPAAISITYLTLPRLMRTSSSRRLLPVRLGTPAAEGVRR